VPLVVAAFCGRCRCGRRLVFSESSPSERDLANLGMAALNNNNHESLVLLFCVGKTSPSASGMSGVKARVRYEGIGIQQLCCYVAMARG